jgi:lysophospholipid acyltransferase (LPLAT)-like uncharacterized protein
VTLSRRKRFRAGVIAAAVTPIFEALGGTYHWHERGTEHLAYLTRVGRPPIFAFWHGRIMAGMLYFRDRGIVVMTSENFDGEWIARVIRRFGFGTARGSSSRGAVKALVQLRRDMANGCPAAFSVDGPRGPARATQPGALWLAGATGNPVVPLHIESSRYWTIRSWDRHQIPKPGAEVAIAIGEPIWVASTDEPTIETGRQEVDRVLARLEAETHAMLGEVCA